MTETEYSAPNQMFFQDRKPEQQATSSPGNHGRSSGSTEFIGKGSNRRLDEKWDIHFTIGSQTFINLISFINEIGYDAVFIFKKREIIAVSVDAGNTHAATIKFEKTELTDYNIKDLDDDAERTIYIDISIMIDELSVNENYPIDFYADTIDKNRFYVVNGKEIVRKQLKEEGATSILDRYKSFLDMMNRLIKDSRYQKVVANQIPISGLVKSLSKKKSQKKNENVIVNLLVNKNELDFRIEDEVKGSSIVLSGEDIMLYPMENDFIKFNLEYLNKYGKLKLSYNVSMYICGTRVGSLPVILESRFGGGKVLMYYLIAPRVDDEST